MHVVADQVQFRSICILEKKEQLALRHNDLTDAGLRHLGNGLCDGDCHAAKFAELSVCLLHDLRRSGNQQETGRFLKQIRLFNRPRHIAG